MADMHDIVIVGVPLIAILAGILFNNSNSKDLRSEMKDFRSELKGDMKELRSEMKTGVDGLRSEMKTGVDGLRSEMKTGVDGLRSEMKTGIAELRSEMNARFDLVDAELRYFHGTLGKHEARIDAVEKRG